MKHVAFILALYSAFTTILIAVCFSALMLERSRSIQCLHQTTITKIMHVKSGATLYFENGLNQNVKDPSQYSAGDFFCTKTGKIQS